MKFVAWGCKDINSTHSFIHYAYKKAFESLGYESYWFDHTDDTSTFDFSNTLFLTLGGHDQGIPLRRDCKYILHNCELSKYNDILDNSIILQVYTNAILVNDLEKIDDCIFYEKSINTLYQPWATDLLPSEINLLDSLSFSNEKIVYWIGSIWNNEHNQGNNNQMNELYKALSKRGINIEQVRVGYDKNKEYINKSFISPTIVGQWQAEKDYIPCRIFKNISYGEFGITNSKAVYDLFEKSILFDNNIDNLIEKSLEYRDKITINEINNQIQFVKDKHTYINRIENLLKFI